MLFGIQSVLIQFLLQSAVVGANLKGNYRCPRAGRIVNSNGQGTIALPGDSFGFQGLVFAIAPCRASLASDSACASRPAAVATEFSTKNIFNYDGSVKLQNFSINLGLPGIGDGNWDGPCLRAHLPASKWNFFAATKRTNRCFSSKSARHKGESIKAIYALNCCQCSSSSCSCCCQLLLLLLLLVVLLLFLVLCTYQGKSCHSCSGNPRPQRVRVP